MPGVNCKTEDFNESFFLNLFSSVCCVFNLLLIILCDDFFLLFFTSQSRPSTLGMAKPVPTGSKNCLAGLTFVISGVLDSLQREEADELIKKYGGRVTSAISKKTNYLIKGADAGASKTRDAEAKGVAVIDEDELFRLISTRPEGNEADKIETKSKGGAAKSKAKAKPKKKSKDDEDEEEEEEEEKIVTKKKTGGRSMPSFL